MGMTGLFGGAFDPPHNGHVAFVRDARRHFAFDRLVILVAANPGHKRMHLSPECRLELARLAFPDDEIVLDEHARTVDLLRARRYPDPIFLIGADEFCDFPQWKDPDGVLEKLERPDRVEFFDIEPVAVASRDLRARAVAGDPLDALVPRPVANEIARLGLYRGGGYTASRIGRRTEEH